MPIPDKRRGGRGSSRRRLWLISLSAVVLAVAGATVAVQSASGQPGPRWHPRPHRPPVAAPTTPTTPTTPATPAATAPAPTATEPAATTPAATTPAATTPSATVPATTAPADAGCDREATGQVTVTDVDLPNQTKGYGRQGDTEVLPMAVAANPDGTSWLAWVGNDEKVYLGKLGCDDQLVGKPTSFSGIDLQDVQADSKGGVLLLTQKGECGTGPLCGGTSSPCNTMHMIRFDTSGQQVWDQQVTNLSSSRQGYSDGARFVWWYQHHGRLASDGENYAAYFGTAITVKNGNCVDIHQGDRMQVVSADGKLVPGKGFEVGCSHAWNSRIVYDPAKKDYVTVCATDNQCRIAQANPYRTVAVSKCDGTLFGGDLVLAEGGGYWTAWSQGNAAKLSRFSTGQATTTLEPGAATQHPHLVNYGTDQMLLAWGSGTSTQAKVLDRSTGATVGSTLTIAADEHDYIAFKEYADGSVAFPAKGDTTSTIKIARVLPTS